jgi:hypothetical protein
MINETEQATRGSAMETHSKVLISMARCMGKEDMFGAQVSSTKANGKTD